MVQTHRRRRPGWRERPRLGVCHDVQVLVVGQVLKVFGQPLGEVGVRCSGVVFAGGQVLRQQGCGLHAHIGKDIVVDQ